MAIMGNVVGGASTLGKTLILEGEDGTQIVGVITEQESVFNAKPSDVRIGKKVVTDSGVIEGTNTLTYRTRQSTRLIRPGDDYSIPLSDYNLYDFTKLQCIIVTKNTSLSDSFAAEKIVLDDGVYQVGSVEQISTVTKNIETKSIDLNLINDTDETKYIRYFTYKDEEE